MDCKPGSTSPDQRRFGCYSPESGLVMLTSSSSGLTQTGPRAQAPLSDRSATIFYELTGTRTPRRTASAMAFSTVPSDRIPFTSSSTVGSAEAARFAAALVLATGILVPAHAARALETRRSDRSLV